MLDDSSACMIFLLNDLLGITVRDYYESGDTGRHKGNTLTCL